MIGESHEQTRETLKARPPGANKIVGRQRLKTNLLDVEYPPMELHRHAQQTQLRHEPNERRTQMYQYQLPLTQT